MKMIFTSTKNTETRSTRDSLSHPLTADVARLVRPQYDRYDASNRSFDREKIHSNT